VITASGEAGTAAELFDKGKRLLLAEKYKEAAEAFDLVLKGEPEGRLGPMALFHAGLAYEGLADRESALSRYKRVVETAPKDELVKMALLRIGRLQIHAERWGELNVSAGQLLARTDLTVSEKLEALGARALGLVETGDADQAQRLGEQARTLLEKNRIGEFGHIPQEVALVFFSLGEARRVKSERLTFDPMPPNFGEAFEARASGLLDAQNAYTDALRTTDPFWATWAGYRVGQLYQQLHRDVMVIKLPDKLKTTKDKTLFEGALQLRYRILLEKGLKMMDSTVRMNERLNEQNSWSGRAKEARAELVKAIADANAAIKKTGVPEETLKKALDDIGKKPLGAWRARRRAGW
jgi:tetratricopeptide (TPR) repeat protein